MSCYYPREKLCYEEFHLINPDYNNRKEVYMTDEQLQYEMEWIYYGRSDSHDYIRHILYNIYSFPDDMNIISCYIHIFMEIMTNDKLNLNSIRF